MEPVRRPAAPTPRHPPLGCHRPRIPDRIIFDKLIQVLVFGCGYRRVEDATCSATTLRRRRNEWIALGLGERLHLLVLAAYDRMLGLQLDDLAVDGCITKAPCGGQVAGRSPVDRGKQGLKRSLATDAAGIPLATVPAPANRNDSPLLAPTLDKTLGTLDTLGPRPAQPTVHLDAGYDSDTTRTTLAERDLAGQIARTGIPAPIQATRRWPVERTFAWGNQFGKLRWGTERDTAVVEFWLALAHAIIVLGRLIRQAWTCYRWEDRPSAAPDPPAYWRSLSGDSRLCGAAFAQVAANRLGEVRRSDDRLVNDDPWLTSSGCACSTPRSMR